jgi:hypothetical protein
MPELPLCCHCQRSGHEPEQGGILGDYANEWEWLTASTHLAMWSLDLLGSGGNQCAGWNANRDPEENRQ